MSRLNKEELERVDLYEQLIRAETSSARRRWHLRKLLNWHKKLLSKKRSQQANRENLND